MRTSEVLPPVIPAAAWPRPVAVDVHRRRRAELAARMVSQLGAGAVAIIPTAPEQPRNRDSFYPYRHDSYFYYLTGFSEPHAVLVIVAESASQYTATLFCQPRDEQREIWDGIRLGPEAAPDALGVDAAHSIEQLDALLPAMLDNRTSVWWPFASHASTHFSQQGGLGARLDAWLQNVRNRVRTGVQPPIFQGDACAVLDEMRLIKDEHEINILRRAATISAHAHVRAMRFCAAATAQGVDLREYHLDAELSHEFRRNGAAGVAYESIVAAGVNACILHYRASDTPVRAGDLVLIDAGCELEGYASDITRTFPANGRFTAAQRALYDITLAAQEAAIAATVAGAPFTAPHDAAVAALAQGMLDVGLLDKNRHGSVQDVIANRSYFQFYMHRTGHWMGMDVHDCGSYTEPAAATSERSQRRDALSGQAVTAPPSRVLRAGMVLTIEPGIYVRAGAGVPERFHGIGIRIEDDAIVQASGAPELTTRAVPVAAVEIEKIMAA